MRQERIDASRWNYRKVINQTCYQVVKGGRNFRFTALVVVGDGNGHVGAGLGKATEIPEAIRKGKEDAMKKMIEITFDENGSITHDVLGKFGSASVLLEKSSGWYRSNRRRSGSCRDRDGGNTKIFVQNLSDQTINRMSYLLRSKDSKTLSLRKMLQDFAANRSRRSWAKTIENVE